MNKQNENPRAEVVRPSPVDSENPPSLESVFGPIIASYSRAEAIDDGVLVDCGAFMWGVKRIVDLMGFHYPVAMTAAAYGAITEGCRADSVDHKIALAGCLASLFSAIKRSESERDIRFKCEAVYNPHGPKVELWCRCGPGDTAEPVLTIMLEGED